MTAAEVTSGPPREKPIRRLPARRAIQFSGAILYVRDVKASLSFYEKAFGLKTSFVSDDASFGALETGTALLGFASITQSKKNWPGGVRETDPRATPPANEVGFATEDVEAAYQRAVAAGATTLAKPEKTPWGQTTCFVRDLDGHVVDISTPWAP